MKPKKAAGKATAAAAPRPAAKSGARWVWIAALAAAVAMAFWAYGPALHGPFLFDDTTLLFPRGISAPLIQWLHDTRPALMTTYWLNARLSGDDTSSYHALNVVIHLLASLLIFAIVRRLLERAAVGARALTPIAAFCAALFLLHPVQTEAVAYLAGRSESLSALFAFAAFAVFLYRKEPAAGWKTAAAVILLFGAALATKQQTVALPALLLLTDAWTWNERPAWAAIRANWRVYAPMALGALAAVAVFAPLMLSAQTAGFGMKDLPWYQYLFTEFRAVFVYLREFVLPVGLNADWDFPVSRSLLDHGAIAGLIALVALAALAWRFRRRFTLASYGFFAFLILLAPTSSILPLRDPVAERRLYFAMLGLLLVAAEVLRRVRLPWKALAGVCGAILLLAAVGTHARAEVWSSGLALWQDSVAKSPNKPRDHFQLAQAYADAGDCARASSEFERTARFTPEGYSRYNLLVDWGLALDCAGEPDAALARFREAAALEPTAHVYTQMAVVYAKRQQWTEAMGALAQAEKLDSTFAPIYDYRARIYLSTNHAAEAIPEFERALALDPQFDAARQGLAAAHRQLGR